MFTQNLDSTVSYRTIARGVGSGFARAYQSQRNRAGVRTPGRGDVGGLRPTGSTADLDAPSAEARRFRA